MYIRLTGIIFFLLFLVVSVQGQEWSRDDFNSGFLKLDSPFDSVLTHLGQPNKTKFDGNDTNFIGFYYTKLTVFKNTRTNRLASFHIYDTTFVTHRGLKVGDPSDRVKKLYGDTAQTTKKFWTGWENDYSFHDYSEAKVFHDGDFNFVVFIKNKRIVKMLFYVHVVVKYEDFVVGFLKLGSPFDSVVSKLGKPDSITEGNLGATGFFYPKLVLWRDNENNHLWAFDIRDTSIATHRGIKIGDSIYNIEKIYGNCDWETRTFGRIGPYDSSFNEYSEYALLDKYDHVLIFFIKENRLVKMLFYLGVEE